MSMLRIEILGIPIDPLTTAGAVARIYSLLDGQTQSHVMTPNSEMLVEASRNDRFRSVLRSSALNLPDSAGLLWAARRMGFVFPERVTGVDTVVRLCSELTEAHPVFLLGGRWGVGNRASEILKERNPRLVIAGTYEGSPTAEEAVSIIQRINETQPHLLLVAYGAPAQDLWIADHLREMPGVRVAMGVGGTFDFLAGLRKRAPHRMQQLGLEWLWRLFQEPSRIGRIWNAVVVFPFLVLRDRSGT